MENALTAAQEEMLAELVKDALTPDQLRTLKLESLNRRYNISTVSAMELGQLPEDVQALPLTTTLEPGVVVTCTDGSPDPTYNNLNPTTCVVGEDNNLWVLHPSLEPVAVFAWASDLGRA